MTKLHRFKVLVICSLFLMVGRCLYARPAAGNGPDDRLYPLNLVYQGAFAYPAGDEWTYSGHALAYYPDGDPLSPADGYPGSLYAVGHAWYQLVGEIGIPAPVVAHDYEKLPRAAILRELTDVTEGKKDNCEYNADCLYRELAGLEYLPNTGKLAWNLRDWYNVAGYDQDSLGWSDLDMSHAQGVWHIGERGNPIFHNARTSNYLFRAPELFADRYLGGKWLISGNHRPAGAFGGSQGPTLYATAPWQEGDPPLSGQDLEATALLYYPVESACTANDFDACHYPGYRVSDSWGGGAWIETGGKSAVLMAGRKGLGNNCYGIPGQDCPDSVCTSSKGWNSDPYQPQLIFYDPQELALVASGDKQPWEVTPYATYVPLEEVFDPDCALLDGVTYDPQRQRVYVAEAGAGPWGATAVHVWEIQPGLDLDGRLYLPLIFKTG